MASLKREGDGSSFDPSPPSSHQAAAAAGVGSSETSALDIYLAATNFLERICLVEVGNEGGSKKLWPALRYASIAELQEAAQKDLKDHVSESSLESLQRKLCRHGGRYIEKEVAYLIGRGKFKRSLASLAEGANGVQSFALCAHRLRTQYKDDAEWKKSYDAAMDRFMECDSDDDDDDSTVDGAFPPAGQQAAPSNQPAVKSEGLQVVDLSTDDEKPGNKRKSWRENKGKGKKKTVHSKRGRQKEQRASRAGAAAASTQPPLASITPPASRGGASLTALAASASPEVARAAPAGGIRTKRFFIDGVWGDYAGELNAHGLRHGKGKLTMQNDEVYEGCWKNGDRDGKGKMQYANGDMYEGTWKADKQEGQGTYRWANGDEYKGGWKEDKREGHGVFCWASGDQCVGGFKGDKRHGQGCYHRADGCVSISSYNNGRISRDGVFWTGDRKTAWLLKYGKKVRKIDLERAIELASELGFSSVPKRFSRRAQCSWSPFDG